MNQTLLLLVIGGLAFSLVFFLTKAGNPSRPKQHVAQVSPVAVAQTPDVAATDGMVLIAGGEFTMGTDSELGWAEEKPAHRVRVDGFWIDATEVTNAQFAKFVEATGYLTTAERVPSVEEILSQLPPGTPAPPKESLVAGSLVFTMTRDPVDLKDYSQWWKWTPGADWKHPEGPDSNLEDREQHPVVQVSWDDAVAYAQWTGKRLPTEAEWELAARGGLIDEPYVWGAEPPDDSHIMANLWQGSFPNMNSRADGYVRTAPVGAFAPNGHGLYDMAGNVWEWCADAYDHAAYARRKGSEPIVNPRVERSADPRNPRSASRAQRGGSFLCHDAYCSRYRPSARHGLPPDTGMSHVGFRCVRSLQQPAVKLGKALIGVPTSREN